MGGGVKVKTFNLYQCEICGTQYNDVEICKACESNHKEPVAVEARYVGKADDQTGYPIEVKVVFGNGRSAVYKRIKSTYE